MTLKNMKTLIKILKILLLLLTLPIWFPLWVGLALWATSHEYPESTYSKD